MNICPSTKVRPYVYFGFNPVTEEFYIGYREANTEPSHIDLFEYRTSSKIVNPIFDQFIWTILAEFEIGDDAYDFEQLLIYENWNNPLLLNENCHYEGKRFKSAEAKTKPKKEVRRASTIGENNSMHRPGVAKKHKDACLFRSSKKKECPHCLRLFSTNTYSRWHGDKCKIVNPKPAKPRKPRKDIGSERTFTQTHKDNIAAARMGMEFSDIHRKNLSKARLGKEPWNKGKRIISDRLNNP